MLVFEFVIVVIQVGVCARAEKKFYVNMCTECDDKERGGNNYYDGLHRNPFGIILADIIRSWKLKNIKIKIVLKKNYKVCSDWAVNATNIVD